MKTLLFSILFPVLAVAAPAASTDADFDTLGGNKVILERAKALAPEQNVSVVQNREVSRTRRIEFAPEFSGTFGGDTYNRTKSLGFNANFHITPRWSAGLKYNMAYNTLTPEGEAMVDRASAEHDRDASKASVAYPHIDYPKSEIFVMGAWYPFYGKLNLLDRAVSQFDWYFLGGLGQVALSSGSTSSYTAGTGIGFWVSRHFSTRVEMRYQNYKAKYFDDVKNMDLAIASIQLGWLL